jgi:DNA-binding CsgD family transcriptional regulator
MTRNTLVDLVYETIDNPDKRSDLVAAFAEVIDAKAAAIAFEDRRLRWASLCVTHGMDRSTIDSYCQYYVGLNPWAGLRPPTVGEVRVSGELLSEAEFRETEFYVGWFQPRGWLHASSIIFHATETERAYLFAVRPAGHPFTKGEIALHKDLAPHLATASRIAMERTALKKPASPYPLGERQLEILDSRGLTPAERRVALARSQEQSVKEIAQKARLSPETVKAHLKVIHKKLEVRNQVELTRLLLDRSRE